MRHTSIVAILMLLAVFSTLSRAGGYSSEYGTRAIARSPDGELIAIAQTDGVITIQNADRTIHSIIQADSKHAMALAWRSDSTQLATGGEDSEIRIWDVATGSLLKSIQAFNDGVFVLAWQPDGDILLASGFDVFRAWDVEVDQPITEPMSVTFTDMRWNPSGTEFAFSGSGLGTGKFDGTELKGTRFEDQITPCFCYSVDYSADGNTILTAGGTDGTVRLWDVETGRTIRLLLEADEVIQDARFLDTAGQEVGAVSDTGTLYLIDLTTGEINTRSYLLNLWSIAPNPANDSLFAIGGIIEQPPSTALPQGVQTANPLISFVNFITRQDR
ncbi:MAG: hypothetical protein J0M33_18950 [Anaerolineae bacterium]|nr:hypothetical protein [Anaerolineae bacterium]